MPIKKKKKKKKAISSNSKDWEKMLRADGKEFWASETGKQIKLSAAGLPHGYPSYPFEEAKKVKTQKQLDHFIEKNCHGMDYSDIATASLKYSVDNWTMIRICKDPEHLGAVMIFLDAIDKNGGAKKTWDEYKQKRTGALAVFAQMTGYKIPLRTPQAVKTFSNELAKIRKHFGLGRKFKYIPSALRNSKKK